MRILAIVINKEPIDIVPIPIIDLNIPLIIELDGPAKSFDPSCYYYHSENMLDSIKSPKHLTKHFQ